MAPAPAALLLAALLLAAVLLAGLALAGCSGRDPAPAMPADVLLEVDGLRIHRGEVEAFFPYVDSYDRRMGRNARIMGILDRYVLPMRLARRAFPERRAELEQRCRALRDAIGNGGYPALKSKGRLVVGNELDFRAFRYELPLPLAEFAFDDANLGQVSPPLETPQGFALISTYDIMRGVSRAQDAAVVYEVTFYTHDATAFAAWLTETEHALRGKLTYVHPEYRDAIPPWLDPQRR